MVDRKNYDEEYKAHAVKLAKEKGGRKAADVIIEKLTSNSAAQCFFFRNSRKAFTPARYALSVCSLAERYSGRYSVKYLWSGSKSSLSFMSDSAHSRSFSVSNERYCFEDSMFNCPGTFSVV